MLKGTFKILILKEPEKVVAKRKGLVWSALCLTASWEKPPEGAQSKSQTRSAYRVFKVFPERWTVLSRKYWQYFRSLYGGILIQCFLLMVDLNKLLCFSKTSCLSWDLARPLIWVVCAQAPILNFTLSVRSELCMKQATSLWENPGPDVCVPSGRFLWDVEI